MCYFALLANGFSPPPSPRPLELAQPERERVEHPARAVAAEVRAARDAFHPSKMQAWEDVTSE
jgi:hypothetical protein